MIEVLQAYNKNHSSGVILVCQSSSSG